MKIKGCHVDIVDMRGWNFVRLPNQTVGGAVYHAYRQTDSWPDGLLGWLYNTFGKPGEVINGVIQWDYIGGNIYLYKEEFVTLFLIRWA